MGLISKATQFAAEVHKGQFRKYTNEPYIVHPLAVAMLVAYAIPDDGEAIAAALLHDTVEDCGVRLEEILEQFGSRVALLVGEMTKTSSLLDGNRQTRKDIDRAALANATDDATHSIKLADLVDNSKSIIEYDPHFAPRFMMEMEQLVAVLTRGAPTLRIKAQEIIADWKEKQALDNPGP